jgi:hypothetical protein
MSGAAIAADVQRRFWLFAEGPVGPPPYCDREIVRRAPVLDPVAQRHIELASRRHRQVGGRADVGDAPPTSSVQNSLVSWIFLKVCSTWSLVCPWTGADGDSNASNAAPITHAILLIFPPLTPCIGCCSEITRAGGGATR